MRPPGSSWQFSFLAITAAAPSPSDNPRPPAHSVGRVGASLQIVNVMGGTDEKPVAGILFVVAGHWEQIAENVDLATETEAQTLPSQEQQ